MVKSHKVLVKHALLSILMLVAVLTGVNIRYALRVKPPEIYSPGQVRPADRVRPTLPASLNLPENRLTGLDLSDPVVPERSRLLVGSVKRVVDGDTFITVLDVNSLTGKRDKSGSFIIINGKKLNISKDIRVRLLGINSPESVDPRRPVERMGKEASDFSRSLLEGKWVYILPGQNPFDKYERLLAWVWLPDGRFVNGILVKEGFAQVYTFSDNPDYVDYLLACQRAAQQAGKGLWSDR